MSFPEALEIRPLDKSPRAIIEVPGSKSIANRALVLAALRAKGYAYALRGVPRCEDTEVMINCLRALGFRVLTEWPEELVCVSSDEEDPTIPARSADLFVANSGTTMRFLTAMVSLGHGRYRLDGTPRMRQRPIEPLLAALRQLGVNAHSEPGNGCPPVVVQGDGLDEGEATIEGAASSQFVSALIMAATRAEGMVNIRVAGRQVSEPYARMTVGMLKQFRNFVMDIPAEQHYEVIGRGENPPQRDKAAPFPEPFRRPHHTPLYDYDVEPDASSASYFWAAAAIPGGEVTIPGLSENSLQGDIRFLDVLQDMGCEAAFDKDSATLRGGPLRGVEADMNDISDTAMTLAAVACFAEGPTTIRGIL